MISNEILRRAREVAIAVDTAPARALVAELDGHRWFIERLPLETTRMFPGDDGSDDGGDSA